MQMVSKPGDAGYIQPGSEEYFNVIGCSEVADILGHGYKSAGELWRIKTRRSPREGHKAVFDRGHDMEPIMARMIQRDHGRVLVSEQVQYRDPKRPWLVYHADGMFAKWTALNDGAKEQDGPGIWEAKAPGSRMAQKMAEEGMTENYLCQGQMGMHVASAALAREISWGTYGFLDYDAYELVAYDTMADADFQRKALQLVERFYDCLVRDTPPDDVEAEKIEVPELYGVKQILTDPLMLSNAIRLAEIMAAVKPLTDEDKKIREWMKGELEMVAEAEVPEVMKFTYKYQKEGEKIDGEGLLTYCEHLVREYDEMAKMVVAMGGGMRPLVAFDRSQWVQPKPPTRVFKPTPIKKKG